MIQLVDFINVQILFIGWNAHDDVRSLLRKITTLDGSSLPREDQVSHVFAEMKRLRGRLVKDVIQELTPWSALKIFVNYKNPVK